MNDKTRLIYEERLTTAERAVELVKSGDRVYIGTCTSVAFALADALSERTGEIEDVTVLCSNVNKPLKIVNYPGFSVSSYFLGSAERGVLSSGTTDYTSFHLSQIDIWCRDVAKPDVLFLEVSAPDDDGFLSFGATGVSINTYLLEVAKTVVLQVNRFAPRVYGEYNRIHCSRADAIVEADEPLPIVKDLPPTPEIQKISDFLVEQIHDGDCIQIGIGGAANAVGYGLMQKNDLGAHTELMGDSLMRLMEAGVVNNTRKNFFPNKTVASFAFGTEELYRFLDANESVYFMPMPMVNSARSIAKNDNMVSVNTALSVDLFGQVVADNIAGRQYSGIGGQVDFVRGAQMSNGGRSYIAMTSTYQDKRAGKQSRIVSRLPLGSAVTTSRADVQYIVTEYGCVNLKTLTMKQRVHAMISLADPAFRAELTDDARAAGLW